MLPLFVRAALPFVVFSLARDFEAALGLVLHTSLREPSLLTASLRILVADAGPGLARAGLIAAAGLGLFAALALERARKERSGWRQAAPAEVATFTPLYLVPFVTLLAVAALAVHSSWPYGHTLAVALTQDLAPGREALVAAVVLARRLPAFSLPVPKATSVFFVSFLAYALLTPDWARRWDNHPGNEPKYLRMAVALGHRLSLDVAPVSASMEELQPEPLATAAFSASAGLLRESWAMTTALASGPSAVGRDAIRATRVIRQTITGKDGGVYYVLAPGPSMMLAPTLLVDRALNLRQGTPGRLAVSVLLFNVLAALLVMAVFQLARDATEKPGLAAAAAFAFALLPPFLFYFFQFYPEMPGALVLAVLFRFLFLRDRLSPAAAWGVGLLLGSLPWLHQKFLPVWFLLGATALWQAYRAGVERRVLVGLAVPQALSLYLTALYNFGIAGSVRPDALFLAWGPGGVTSARVGQGLLGLWLDARYGLLPFVPVYAVALAGLALSATGPARGLWRALPAAGVYYLTVAAADNWAGAVCNLGRYLMPIVPLVVAFAAVALHRAGRRRGVLAVVLALFLVSGLFALALWQDPHAANDSALLVAKSRFADGFQYLPGLFIRTWAMGAPGLAARIAVWGLGLAVLAMWMVRAERGRSGGDALRAACGMLVFVLAAAALLERWPGRRDGAYLGPEIRTAEGFTAFLDGPVRVQEDAFELGPGDTELTVRALSSSGPVLRVLLGGAGLLSANGKAPVVLRPQGVLLDLPLVAKAEVRGEGGVREGLWQASLRVLGPPAVLRFPDARIGATSREPESVEPDLPEER